MNRLTEREWDDATPRVKLAAARESVDVFVSLTEDDVATLPFSWYALNLDLLDISAQRDEIASMLNEMMFP